MMPFELRAQLEEAARRAGVSPRFVGALPTCDVDPSPPCAADCPHAAHFAARLCGPVLKRFVQDLDPQAAQK